MHKRQSPHGDYDHMGDASVEVELCLFDNEFVISIKSNFNFYQPVFNIKFFVKYSVNHDGDKSIKYVKEKINL